MTAENTRTRLYLDNAATSFPKPPAVATAMARYAEDIGASPGRGAYGESREAGRLLAACRDRICRLLNGAAPERVVFTLNTTDALNLAIRGLVGGAQRRRPGRPIHLVTTAMDHNSVLRPFNALAEREADVAWSCVPSDPATGLVCPLALREAITPETALVAVVHASNVSGTVQPLGELAEVCREAGVPIVVDAAQSVGHLPVDVASLGVDLLAFPGHKGLLGPLGTGGLYIAPGMEERLETVREGGTGSVSEADTQPDWLPDKYEPGSHNTIGLVGLSEGVAYLLEQGVDRVREHELGLIERTLERLGPGSALHEAGLRILGPLEPSDRVGVFSMVHDRLPPASLAEGLERRFGILTRAGVHCAPRAHGSFGTVRDGGALRISYGPFNGAEDVERLAEGLEALCGVGVGV